MFELAEFFMNREQTEIKLTTQDYSFEKKGDNLYLLLNATAKAERVSFSFARVCINDEYVFLGTSNNGFKWKQYKNYIALKFENVAKSEFIENINITFENLFIKFVNFEYFAQSVKFAKKNPLTK